ncbi:hypothetical protein IC229_09430 [Spirosoma sp. BT702]|uniref:Ig-like domain-containing protein n=1 Tax=Spirosoma profusum TaxID=2771354 RepID=A0A927AN05_9BACT|nr:SdrD B-like domain-containing protein [Spirosoma profusum]MBD2700859.1 hypothetical protein [Spirosoma profusum]
MRTSTKLFFTSSVMLTVVMLLSVLPSFGQTISGTVFRDFNSNGVYSPITTLASSYSYGEPGVGGVTVTAYNAAGTVVATTTSSTVLSTLGSYSLSVGSNGTYRVEFTGLGTGDYESFRGAATATGINATSVQFVAVSGATANINFAVNYPLDYCQPSPTLVVPCYINGNPLTSGTVGSEHVLVTVPYTSSGTAVTPTSIADGEDIGSVWGVAYQRETKKIFSAAFLKRHVGLGAAGLGGIYTTTTTGTSTLLVDLETTFGINLGDSQLGARASLPNSATASSTDPTAFSLVGKVGLGGMAISTEGKTLYVVDLFNRNLLALNVGNPAVTAITSASSLTTISIPSPGCTNGDYRPFAVSVKNNRVYVGVICSGQSGTATTGTASNLYAHVFSMAEGASTIPTTPILSFRLNYTKGDVRNGDVAVGSEWQPWITGFDQLGISSSTALGGFRVGRPQPMLTDITFADNGDMILDFADRTGFQTGFRQRNTTDVSSNPTLYGGYIGGDLLRATYTGTQWVLENNGIVGPLTGSGSGNTEGPGTPTGSGYNAPSGEFYGQDYFLNDNGNTVHGETSMGAGFSVPGYNVVVNTIMDPTDVFTGGLGWFNNRNGVRTQSAELYSTLDNGGETAGKANGLGGIKALCDPAPIQIGNRVWLDSNNNGRQDPGESPLAGVVVTLTGPGITGTASVTTNANGEYYFSNVTGSSSTSSVFGLTGLTYGSSYSLTFPTTASGTAYLSSNPNSVTGTNGDNIDTDVNSAGKIVFTLGTAGQNNFSYDAAYAPCVLPTLTALASSASVCAGGSVTLTAQVSPTGSYTYVWSAPSGITLSGANTATAVASSLTATGTRTFTVTVSSSPVCFTTATVTVTVNALPTATLSSATICVGQSVVLTATGGTSYTLSTGATSTSGSFTLTPATSTTYSVTVANTSGCRSTTTGAVTVNPLPTAGLTPSSAAICAGQSVVLTATGGTSYTLSTGATNTSGSFTVTPGATTPYSVTVANASGCRSTTTATVTLSPSVTAVFPSATICAGQSATLIATGGTSYTFSNGTNNTNGQLIVAPATTTTYSVTVANASGCRSTANSTVTVNPAVTATLGSTTICAGQTATLSATGGNSYTFSNGTINNTGSFSVTPGATATYSVTVSNGNCIGTATGTVTVVPAVTATFGSVSICAGQTATLTASGGTSYTFSNGTTNTTGSLTVTPGATTAYSVTVSNGVCAATASATVTISPSVTAVFPSATICAGQSATLIATGGTSYTFSNGVNNTNGRFVTAPGITTTYSVTVANASGCRSTANSTVTVNPAVTATLGSTTICAGQTATLTATGGNSYTFSDGTINTSGLLAVNPGATATYSVTVSNGNCIGTATATVTVNPAITATLGSVSICAGQSATLTASGGTSYLLSTGASNTTGSFVVTPTATTVYSVTVSSGSCTGTTSATVTVNPSVTAVFPSATICAGQSATLIATGGTSYTFSNGVNNTNGRFVTAPGITTTYSVTVANASGCRSTANSTVTVNPAVTATLGSTTICAGQTATLTATGGNSYTFSDGTTNNSGLLAVIPGGTTTYSVTVSNGNCIGTATGTVTVNPAVAATLSSATICAGQSVTLTATGGTSYTFSNGTVNNTGSLTLTPGATATYSVTVSNGNCIGTASGTVTVNAAVTATLSSVTICLGQTANLIATGGNSFTFSNGTINNTGTLGVSPAATNTYSVTVMTSNGTCTGSASGTVTVNQLPTPTLSSATICAGQSVNLTATGGVSYTFSNGTTNTSGLIAVNPTTSTPYSVTVANASGCRAVASGNVTVNTIPTATLTPSPTTICAGASTTLTASGGTNYRFSNGTINTTGILVVAPANTTTYSVTVTSGSSCSAVASAIVTVNPAVTATLTSATVCSGTSATLVATGGSSYRFSFLGGITNTSGILITPVTTTTVYSVTVTSAQGCSDVTSGTVTVNTPTSPTISGSTTLCAGQTISLTANPTTGLTYAWSGPGGSLGSSNPLTIPNSTTAQSGTYQVLVTNANGCTATSTYNVTVKSAPQVQILTSNVTCNGNTPGVIISTEVTGGTPPVTYAWYRSGAPGVISTSPNPSFTVADSYSLVVTDASGCVSNTATINVTQSNPIAVNAQSTNALCYNGQGTITVNISGGTGPYSVTYANAGGVLSTANTTGFSSIAAVAGSYTITVTDANGCSVTQTAAISQPAPLTVTLTPGSTICADQSTGSVTSSVSGGTSPYSYSWSNGATTPNLSNVAGASYTVVITDANGCSTTGTVTVPTYPTPSIPGFALTQPSCATITGTISVTNPASGVEYSFDNGATYQASPTRSGLTPAIYRLRVRDLVTGCRSGAVNVTINPAPTPPVASISGTTNICAGQSISLTASPSSLTYAWTGPGGSVGTTNPLVIANATPSQSGTYQVRVTDANNCTAVASTNVTVNALPTATLTSTSICIGQSANLVATGGTSYTLSTGATSTSGNFTVTPGASTTYTVTVANANGCISTTTGTVTVNSLPTAGLSSAIICAGNSATLTASGGTSYTFSNGTINNTGILIVSPAASTTYAVTVANASGCVSTTTATVTVNQNPSSSLSSATICAGQSATLTASGGASYTFSNGTTSTDGLLVVAPGATTTYSVTASGGTNCISFASGTVMVNQLPVAGLTPSSASICIGQAVVLTASGGSSYTFSTGETNTTGSITATPTSTTAYSVTVANGSGCISTTNVTVAVNQLPTVTLSPVPGTICVGQSTSLVATGAISYTFSTGTINIGGRVLVSPTATASYSVIGVSASGCYNTATTTVPVNDLPTPALTNATICVGQSATLTASGGSSYSFSTGATNTDGVLEITPGATTTYSVTVANASGCTSTTTGTVTVNQLAVAGLTPSSTSICEGQSVVLTATGGSSYTFSTGETNTTGSITATPTSTTAYSVTVANGSNCISTTSVTVTVNTPPTPAITSATICEGQSATLIASGGTSYTFSTGETNTTGSLAVSPTTTTTYTVTVANATGCISTTTGTVTVNQLPTATVSASSATICAGLSTTLTASGGTSYTFSTGETNNTGILPVTPTTTTTYSVTVANASGCISTTSAIVTVSPSATAILNSTTICAGETTELIADGGTSYTFSTGEINTTGRLQVSPTTTTTYSVTAVNASGCVSDTSPSAATGTVYVDPVPVAGITATSTTICEGQSVTLTATGGTSYDFSTGDINTSGILVVTPTLTTTYVAVVGNDNGCESTTSITVTVNPLPTAAITSATICEGQSATLIATGGTSYSFSTGEVNTSGILIVSPTATATYSVTMANASGCVSSTTGSVTVNTVPVASLTPASATICEGQSVTLTASGGTSYSFSTGTSTTTGIAIVSPVSSTAYSVTVSNGDGCASTASVTVTVNSLPAATLTSATICEGQSATLTATGGTSYTFSTGEVNTTGSLAVSPATTTTYSVTVSNSSGCVSTTSAAVTVNEIPVLTLTSETICANLTTTLRATPGFTTYIFSAGLSQIGVSNEASGSVDGTYSVTAITAQGCSATATGSILINSNPVVQLSSATICTGQSATLIATSGYDTYIFSNNLAQVGNSNVAVGTLAGTYSVTAISTGCSGVGSGSITIEPYPTAELTSATICAGQSATLVATGGTSYTFSNGTINTTGLLDVTPAITTTYSVTVANAAGCASTTIGSVTVNPLPVAELSSATICIGQSATLTATGGATYLFSNGINNATGELIVSPISTTAYSVTIVTTSGCVSNTTATVTVNELPVATLTSATICLYESATLVATGGTSYTFSDGTENLTGLLVAGPSSTTAYSVTVANASGCISTSTATVTVNPLPTINTLASCNGIATYDVSFTATPGATVTASAGTIVGNQVTGVPSGQAVEITVTLNGCSITETVSQNCESNAATLGNYVWNDLDQDGIQDDGEPGIEDVVVVLLQNGVAVATTFTDADGHYRFNGLTPGIPYSVSFTTPAGFTATLVHQHIDGNDELDSDADPITGLTPSVTLAAGESNLSLDAGFYIPRASLGNFVWNDLNHNGIFDTGEPGIPGVVVTLIQNGTALVSTTTDANGLYSFTGLTPGIPYSLSFTTPLNYSATLADQGGNDDLDSDPIGGVTGPITLTAGENNTSIDAGFYLLTAALGNFVFEDLNHNGIQDSGEPGIQGVVVTLISNGTALVASTTTDVGGFYSFTGLTPGIPYSVSFAAPTGYTATLADQGTDDAFDSDGNVVTGLTGTYSLTANEVNFTIDMGYYRPASVGDFVFLDINHNGIQDSAEPGLADVVVTLLDGNNTPIASVTTTSTGLYSFTGLTPGVPYSLSFSTPVGYTATLADQGGNDDLDADPIGGLVSFTLTSGQSNTSVDAGYYPVTAALGNFVFEDLNHNGIQDTGEPGIQGVVVTLISNGTAVVASTTTDVGGFYSFTGLTPGTPYSLSFAAPTGYSATLQNQGPDDTIDSDGNEVTGLTGTYSLTANEVNNTIDIGYYRPASLNGYVWIDTDHNGQQGGTEPPLPGVIVTLIQNGTVVASTTTDASGLYSFTGLTPGTPYSLSFTTPTNFTATAADQGGNDAIDSDPIGGLTPSVTLTSGQSVTQDAGYYPLTAALGNFVFEDLNHNGIQDSGEPGIQGVTVTLISSGTAVVASTTTDVSGFYSFTGLTPGTPYSLSFTAPTGYTATLTDQGTDDTIDSDGDPITGLTGTYSLTANELNETIDMGYYRPASLNGYVWIDSDHDGIRDNTESPLQGVIVTLIQNGTVVATTLTDAGGLYSFTGLTAGIPYSLSFTTPAGYTATEADQGGDDTVDSDPIGGITGPVTLTAGENQTSIDAGFYPVTAGLGNFVFEDLNHNGIQDSGEPGIQGVTVTLISSGTAVVASTTTDVSGFYSFTGLTPGTPYSLSFTAPTGYSATLTDQGTDDMFDSDGDVVAGLTGTYSLTANEFNNTIDMGYYRPASLNGYVWIDSDHNGIQDSGEPALPGVIVTLIQNGTVVATTTTDASGLYSFTGLTPGLPYSLSFTTPAGYTATLADQGGNDNVDSDPIGGLVGSFTLASGQSNVLVDAGFYPVNAALGNFVFEDLNHNGIQDSGEPGIQGVVVTLISNGTAVVASTTTDVGGFYSFTGLTPGTPYSLSFSAPTGYSATLQNQGGDDVVDSDGNELTGLTGTYSLTANELNDTVDMGYYRPASLNGYVWIDSDHDGIQDAGESPLQGVIVTLIQNGTVVATTLTDANGLYSFTGLTPGTPYSLSFTTPTNFTATAADQGGNDAIDSDPIGGLTPSVTLTSGQSVTQDAGYYPLTAALGNFVFEDLNHNGIQDSGEPGIQGVTVNLIENGVILVATTTTDANGLYSFTGLTPGTPYSLSFSAPTGYTATLADQGGDDDADSDGNVVTGLTGTYSLTANEVNNSIDMGYYRPASVGDFVFLDINHNGIQDSGEPGLAGVVVTLLDGTNTLIASVTTTSTGLYSFTGLTPGVPYSLSFSTPVGYTATLADQGGNDELDSDPIGGLVSFTLASGQSLTTVDAGYYVPTASIGSTVWNDLDRDGQRDPGEPGVDGVTVRLLVETTPGNYTVVSTTVTTGGGHYLFTNLPAGTYIVEFDLTTLPAGFIISPNNNRPGVPNTENSDANPTTGRSAPITLDPANPVNPEVLAIDAGLETDCPPAKCVPFVITKTRSGR